MGQFFQNFGDCGAKTGVLAKFDTLLVVIFAER